MKKQDLLSAFASCAKHVGANPASIADIEHWLGKRLPSAYVELMSYSNGIEGFVRENYIALWPVEQLKELNEVYAVAEFAPGLLLIGSNGADTGFALDIRHEPMDVKEVPFVGMSHEEAKAVARNFNDFVEYLRSRT